MVVFQGIVFFITYAMLPVAFVVWLFIMKE